MRNTMPTVPSRIHSAVEIRPTMMLAQRLHHRPVTLHDPHVRRRTAEPLLHAARERFELRDDRWRDPTPGARRATARGPNPPGVTCAARMLNGIQNATRSSGKRNSGLMTPITVRFWPAKV